jgi:hypothetical protein
LKSRAGALAVFIATMAGAAVAWRVARPGAMRPGAD